MKKKLSLFLCFIMLMGLFFEHFSVISYASPGQTKINKTKLTLTVGEDYDLTIVGTTQKVVWKSNNSLIATVSKTGNVKALKVGNTIITATVGKSKYNCKLTIKDIKYGKITGSITWQYNQYIGKTRFWSICRINTSKQ